MSCDVAEVVACAAACVAALNYVPIDQVATRVAVSHVVNEYLGGVTTSRYILVRLEDSLKKLSRKNLNP